MGRETEPLALNLARILYRLMVNPRGWRVDHLQEELGIADRTYRKYRALLLDHFPSLCDRRGESLVCEVREGEQRYLRIRPGGEPLEREPGLLSQVTGIEMARQLLDFLRDTGIGASLESLRPEILDRAGEGAFLVRSLFRDIDRKLFHIPEAPKDYSQQGDKIAAILHGLFHTKRLRMLYHPAEGEAGWRVIEPLTLVLHRSALYLLARHKGGKRPYTFAVDRMREVARTGEKFAYPSAADYSPGKFTEGQFGIFHEPGGRPTRVELVFADEPWLKLDLKERRWHPTQRFQDLPDGRLRMTFTVRSMVEVWPWIRSFGDQVEVISPSTPSAPGSRSQPRRPVPRARTNDPGPSQGPRGTS